MPAAAAPPLPPALPPAPPTAAPPAPLAPATAPLPPPGSPAPPATLAPAPPAPALLLGSGAELLQAATSNTNAEPITLFKTGIEYSVVCTSSRRSRATGQRSVQKKFTPKKLHSKKPLGPTQKNETQITCAELQFLRRDDCACAVARAVHSRPKAVNQRL